MSPETGQMEHPMMDEARIITNELITVQTRVEEVANNTEAIMLKGIREKLGYEPVLTNGLTDIVDTRISNKTTVITPHGLATVLPVSKVSAETTRKARNSIEDILSDRDDRLIVITGPCSIHDPEAALEYAQKVKEWREEYGDDLEILMRAYFEKPRTEKDWKGLVYDPLLDGSDDINLGLTVTRLIATQITSMGVPIASERLNALTPQYLNGLVAYDAIGARNTTDQKSREYASGTSSPVGIKNTPEGSIKAAAEGVKSANAPHTFLGMSVNGLPMQVGTTGNDTAHIILRGSDKGPNYDEVSIAQTKSLLAKKGLPKAIVIDASHANSGKDETRQIEVIRSIAEQLNLGETAIKGVMIESNLQPGKQKLVLGEKDNLKYAVSVTDGCVDLTETETMLQMSAKAVMQRRELATA